MSEREFVLTNGTKFIKCDINGQYKEVSNLNIADIYDSQKTATNVMLNSISKALSRTYYVAEIVDGNIIQCSASRPNKVVKSKSKQSYRFDSDFADTKWCKSFVGLEDLFKEAIKRGRELSQEISDIDSQITDIEHYIEFNSLNCRDGFKIYKKLKDVLQRRRYLKNEQKIVNAINKNHSASEHIKNITSVIGEYEKCEYQPRILINLFENGVKAITD
jgi:hypothetical protein